MNRAFVLLILIHWYRFILVKSSSSFFDFDKYTFQAPYYINENFSIGATFNLPSSYKCFYSQCITDLKLILKNDHKLLINLWCDSPAVLITTKKYEKNDELSCVLNGINATVGSYRLSAVVQVHTAGSFIPIFSAIFPNNPNANQEWLSKEIVILNSPTNEQQSIEQRAIKRKKRQDINIDGANIQPIVNQDVSVNNDSVSQIQTMPVNDGANIMNQPIQLNIYSGTLDSGHTADLTCNGASSCPDYPKIDEQGRAICCFPLPQVSNGVTAISSVIYQNGTQNLNDFQVNVGNGQSFNAANDLSVFLSQVIPASQCNVIIPTGSTQSTSAQFRLTWIYHSNSANSNSPPPSLTSTLNDGTLPVNVLSVTSASAFVQQRAGYNEWFVCPPSQDGQVSLLRSIALLAGNNIDYLRCIYVNNQGIPLKDPTNGQLLVFTSTKNSALDNPTITSLPAVHTDCISIQFFPNAGTSIDLNSILLSITIAFQTAPTSSMSSVMPQVSDLQGTYQIGIDITVDASPMNDNNVDNNGQTNVQTFLSPASDNLSNASAIQCTRYQTDLPMSYDISIGKYTGTFDIPSEYSQPTIIDSVTVTGSSTVENPITMLLVDSQGNTLSPSYSLTSGITLQGAPKTSISKIILQATALQDAAMDSTLHIDIVVCPTYTGSTGSFPSAPSPSIPSPQTYIPVINGVGSSPISNVAPIQPIQPPSSVSSDGTANCQERTSSTYGTYPPDLSGSTIPTKKPPKMLRIQPTIGPNMYATPSTPYQNINVQMSPDQTCFDQISFTNNPFLYDIFISTSDYTNTIDCLSPTSGCSINFTNAKQPKITLLFTAPICTSYLRIPSPSNVQQFSYSMYDENGLQIPLPGAIDNQGTLLSSYGSDPVVQLNQYSCGYSIILQLLTTSNNGPPIKVTIDTGGCFRDMSATTTPIVSMAPANAPSSSSQQVPSLAPAPSNMQPAIFAPSPVFARPPTVQVFLSLPPAPPSSVVQQSPSSIQAAPPPSPLAPPYMPLPSSSVSSQSQYFQAPPSPPPPPAPVFIPLPPSPSEPMRASPILSYLPPPPPPLLPPPVLVAPPPGSFQAIVPSPILQPPPPPVPQLASPAIFPSAPLPSQTIVPSPILSPPLPPPPPPPIAPAPVLIATPPLVFQTIVASTISYPPPDFVPSLTIISSPILQTPPAPLPNQTILPSPILSSSPSSAVQSPIIPAQQYPSLIVNSSSIYQAPLMSPPPSQPLPSPVVSSITTTESLTPLVCTNNSELRQLTLYSPCVSQILTSDPSVLINYQINPGAQGINFQSNVPITINIQLNCSIQMMYMCIPGPTTNVRSFSYALQDTYNNPVASGAINPYGSDQCVPRPLNIMNPVTQLFITISETKDGQPPRNVVLDLQGCNVLTAPTIPTSPPFIAVTPPTTPTFWPSPSNQPSSPFVAPAPPPIQIQPPVPLQTAPIPVPIQVASPSQQTSSIPIVQNAVTPASTTSMNICPEVSLASYPGVELIVSSDGTNISSDLDPDGNGCNFVSIGSTITVLLRSGMSATFSSVGVSSPNVNQIDVALFDELSNSPLIRSPQGIARSAITLNPSVQNLPVNPAATLAVTFLSTTDGQPPKNVKLLVYACFPTVTEISPIPASSSPPTSSTNTLNPQPYFPVNPSIQTYPSNQQYQYPSTGPTNVCIDPSQPAQVTSVANTALPPEYYSSNQCVCICQLGIVMPTSSGVIQYYPSSRTIKKRTITEKYSEQRHRKIK